MHLENRTAFEAARDIAAGDISAEELARALLENVSSAPELNAFVSLDADRVLAEARAADAARSGGSAGGPLLGVPISFKDNINVRGYVTTAGTPTLRNFRPAKDAPVVKALRNAGAVVFGKTGMHELAYGATSNNRTFGAPRNPHDVARSAGGSSGGSAVAVAGGLCPVSIGTDTGGSVRIPAALCGVWGFRPTVGRWPAAGVVPISTSRDTPGPITRSARDLALLDSVVSGVPMPEARGLRGLRVGIPEMHFWAEASSDVVDACQTALAMLVAEGVELVSVDPLEMIEHHRASSMEIALFEGRAALDAFLAEHELGITYPDVAHSVAMPDVREILLAQCDPRQSVTLATYHRALTIERPALIAATKSLYARGRIDLLASPTARLTAPLLGEDETVRVGERREPVFAALIHNTDVFSNAGLAGVTVPVGVTPQGLPVGLALDGPAGADDAVLSVALALEPMFAVPRPPQYEPDLRFVGRA